MVAGLELSGQAVGGLRSPVADGSRRRVASTCRADVAAGELTEVRIKKIINYPLAFQEKLVHTSEQWQSSDIAGVRYGRKTSSLFGR